jgi:CelD/BcsL family acetyltransferase involved in cellulose biosynthesis
MKITIIKGEELSIDLCDKWLEIQKDNCIFHSPFLSPYYINLVAKVKKDVYVAIIEENNEIVGFFPFQKDENRFGMPVGKGVTDYQGVILKQLVSLNAIELISKCNLNTWEFDHLITSQNIFELYYTRETISPLIDLSNGYEVYKKERIESGTKQISQIEKQLRKIENEIGSIMFKTEVDDFDLLQKLINWKSAQFKQTGAFDDFSLKWVRELYERIFYFEKKNEFKKLLSTFYINDDPIAIELGLVYKNIDHGWCSAYNKSYSKYSPGLILQLKIIEIANQIGITIIDLGKGTYLYKKRLMNGSIKIAEGKIDITNIVFK